ncbi:SPOR domain-containing protein [Halopseudomonas nanhaiensis]|uniref:SPOR domain-containing protein n=1 Tax=Halopseudomonas nanhaiensis TaxID=2830842 RepID=UPI001CC10429|nr:SPOR domain-containing protein [Halopseudomonas nanhaiensis]UAW98177.1 SPOR domain-containing protein [Halopseudomonas nanhaiensis]
MAKGRKAPTRGASRRQASSRPRIPGWLWMVSGLVIGLFVAFLFQLEPGRETVKREAVPPKPAQQAPRQPKPAEQQPRYDFYTLLPESEVIVPETAVPEQAPEAPAPSDPAATEPATRYFLQAGSFRQRADADRVRAQIIMLGLDVQLENAKLGNGETWYRVQVGPFQDRNSLGDAQKTLAGNGFDNLLLQQRTSKQ